ncbi:hypothetical protein BD413DRAFT_543013 [Trametes elegans]|nr:hypothetical protein BD413DRAFT_543013 [Trametes elegans]
MGVQNAVHRTPTDAAGPARRATIRACSPRLRRMSRSRACAAWYDSNKSSESCPPRRVSACALLTVPRADRLRCVCNRRKRYPRSGDLLHCM